MRTSPGIETKNIARSSRKYTEKDVIITYFSSKLYKQDKTQLNHKQLDLWCSDLIQSYFFLENDNKMYIGFCYQTILDGYFSDTYSVPGSTALLLLALTRGLQELHRNNTLGNNHQPIMKRKENWGPSENNFKFASWISCVFQNRENSSNLDQASSDNSWKLKVIKKNEDSDEKFVSANSRGIVIKKSFSWIIVGAITLLYITFIILLRIKKEETNQKPREQIFRIIEIVMEVIPSCVTIELFLLKLLLLRNWEINDMLRGRRRTQSLKELCASISPNRMEKMARAIKLLARDIRQGRMPTQSLTEFRKSICLNRTEKKARAIKLLTRIQNPKEVFARDFSCAFVEAGNGEFEIDDDITIEDLRKAGYKFGVNYYGQPVVADTRAQVRSVKFEEGENKPVRISGLHELQPKYIFQLPTRDLIVAGTNSSSRFSETVADYV